MRTAGAPAALRLTPDRKELAATGEDLCYILVEALDDKGTLCPLADNLVRFKVDGPGRDRRRRQRQPALDRAVPGGLSQALLRQGHADPADQGRPEAGKVQGHRLQRWPDLRRGDSACSDAVRRCLPDGQREGEKMRNSHRSPIVVHALVMSQFGMGCRFGYPPEFARFPAATAQEGVDCRAHAPSSRSRRRRTARRSSPARPPGLRTRTTSNRTSGSRISRR